MNINEPQTSRVLSILIQNVAGEDRDKFIGDAKRAPDMKTFMEDMGKYKTVIGRDI